MPDGLDVRSYEADQLYDSLSNERFTKETVRRHRQAVYIHEYLEVVGAKTMVVEPRYVDKDYLADFASFYVTCFEPYDRFCKRLHFFSCEFDAAFLERIVLGKAESSDVDVLRNAYLGFVVARPLPQAVVGRTLLVPYPSDDGRRKYKAILTSYVRLFGLELEVRSLAFQEQDTAVAACATVSIWSALQKTSELFGTRAPQPPEITRCATRSLLFARALPTSGLHLEQMLFAIREAGLDPELYEPISGRAFRPIASLIYGYCNFGLPVILIGELEGIGGHAVTIAGYSRRPDRVVARELPTAIVGKAGRQAIPEPFALTGRWIDEFYAHDDAMGPFSRLRIERPNPGVFDPRNLEWNTRFFSDDWNKQEKRDVPFLPTGFIVPVYPKIRLRYDDVLVWIARVNALMMTCSQSTADSGVWDIYITDTNRYKSQAPKLSLDDRRVFGLLVSSQPRFIWRATFSRDTIPIAEFLLDATSFAKAFPVFAINWFDDTAAERAQAVVRTGRLATQLTEDFSELIVLEIDQRNSATIGRERGSRH